MVKPVKPRVCSVPAFVSSRGVEAVELAASAGLVLDPWEAFVLERALGVGADGKWSAFEVGLVVSRQNGKGAVLEARELAGLFLLGERLVIHSAHQFDTSLEAFRRLLMLVEQTPDLDQQVKRVSRSHGEEGIELKSRQRIRFRTRTKGGGRGFTGDCLILDEAMFLPEFAHGALLPTVSARPNPQVWYTGSAVDQFVHADGVVLTRVRERGLKGERGLAYFEWSLPQDRPDDLDESQAEDPGAWGKANPALGIRISEEHVANEQRSMDPRTFAVERLGVGDWPPVDHRKMVINLQRWADLVDIRSAPLDPVCFSFDVTPDRSFASIGVSGRRDDGLFHVEVVERRRGTGWLAGRLVELGEAHRSVGFVCDGASPAASLIPVLEANGLRVIPITAQEYAAGCGLIFDAVVEGTLRHLGTSEIHAAIKGAVKRPLGDAWAWSRKNSAVDISPLVAITLSHWGSSTQAIGGDGFSLWDAATDAKLAALEADDPVARLMAEMQAAEAEGG